jgi:hypothetical protein
MKRLLTTLLLMASVATAAPLGDYQFKSPAFSGIGYSSHVLTIENQERTRLKERADKIQAALDKEAADAKNTNLSKFLSNLESRIYAQISQNVATAMFKNNSCTLQTGSVCEGSIDYQDNVISWSRTTNAQDAGCSAAMGSCIVLKVADPTIKNVTNPICGVTVGYTCIYVPLESFTMPGN